MRAIIVFITLLNISTALSQSVDSLKSALNQTKDTGEVYTLIHISEVLINSKLQESSVYAKKALDLAQKIDFEKGQILSLNLVGNYHQRQGSYDTAMVYYQKSLEISERLNDV